MICCRMLVFDMLSVLLSLIKLEGMCLILFIIIRICWKKVLMKMIMNFWMLLVLVYKIVRGIKVMIGM